MGLGQLTVWSFGASEWTVAVCAVCATQPQEALGSTLLADFSGSVTSYPEAMFFNTSWVFFFKLWEFPKIWGTVLWDPYNKDPTI